MSKYVAGTRFHYVTIHGMDIPRTAFGDGFDTGDVLVCDRLETNGRPRFLVVISRTAAEVEVAEVGTMLSIHSFYAEAEAEVAMPALGVTVNRTLGYRLHDGIASFPDGSGVARPWDGHGIPVAA